VSIPIEIWIYALALLAIWGLYLARRSRRHARAARARSAAVEAGLNEPVSLHPVIDPARCLGSGACYRACPEGDVIGMINGKAQLINAAHCIGHGACRAACPMDAITLVFGTERRGVDIPHVKPNFETNVPGLFIAGELGGMGLIRNAIEQGRQAIREIGKLGGIGRGAGLDVVIIGAGPAGLSAALAAQQAGLRYVVLEQESLGGTVAHYPRGKIVMTAPVELAIIGKVRLRETTKESLLHFWQDVEHETGIRVEYQQRVDKILPSATGFSVHTVSGVHETRAVLLAIGRRGTPRKLGVPGEELSKVVYRLIDPEQYRGQRVLVVGGGDSALEAAASIAEQPDTTVTLSYRSEAFSRAKQKNRERIESAERSGHLKVLLKSKVTRIEPDRVELDRDGERLVFDNDAVIVSAGGVLPTAFLKSIGIEVETKYGTA
jgi:thioredoxin reductase/ferredoxin